MKFNNLFNLVGLGTTLTITGFGCKTKPQKPLLIPGQRQNIGDNGLNGGMTLNGSTPGGFDNSATQVTPAGISANPHGSHDGWKEDTSSLSAQTVYFDYD